ncbi:FAD-dependent thymidylate synthase [Streptomyces sp. PDY-4]|uniref:FAD-dependent thymidylate synthase n=1 Tax=Streptomyces sp. PDY-4 TaxID=3376070 RepID=UPI003788B78C
MTINLIDVSATDAMVARAARVSTIGKDSAAADLPTKGLINFLMRDRHGSPFEHNSMTFYVHAPMVVFWQMVRHRAGWSYNLESGRYKELSPEFYVPEKSRPLVQVGKAGAYEFVQGDDTLHDVAMRELMNAYEAAWDSYQNMLKAGICREIARLPLGFGIYFSGYVTCNSRSLMHFLSLRTKNDDAQVKSSPQFEINAVADQLEDEWAKHMPVTHAAFVKHGRVAP